MNLIAWFMMIVYSHNFLILPVVLVQQSTSESKPREAGQLFNPQARPS